MKRARTPVQSFAENASGSALVEASLVIPLSLLLLGGVADFGLAINTFASANKSVRDAARYMAGTPAQYCDSSPVRTYALGLANQGNTANITTTQCTTPDLSQSCSKPADYCVATVSGTIQYNSIILGALNSSWAAITFPLKHVEPQIGN